MKKITGIILLLAILLFHNLSLAKNVEDMLPLNQGAFFTQTIQLRQGVGVAPAALAITPDGRKVVVASPGSNTVGIIDLENPQAIATIPVGDEPGALALTPDGRKAVVAHR
ncbi:MAG: hypothetical protein HYY20_03485 [Candidatus Tectomicrobia bacterium]|uniref:Uncharacterized protein n=1 Tax=Tectimicrobiota bacterium TaxID=2528274 RepID=A0A932FW42_UNCTE|nr:hypothetical protein [Candidatus Tectomicrobia bacterium]